MKLKKYIFLAASMLALTACEDVLEPELENNRGTEIMQSDPVYAQGLMGYAYATLPYSTKSVSDVATDDAVTNETSSSYIKMALGNWAANNNPMEKWQSCRSAIQYLNTFLSIVDDVQWAEDEVLRQMFADRLRGEAYALRALNMIFLLQAHGGETADGQLLGVPIVTEPENASSNFDVPRNTFKECMDFIISDLDMAAELLPLDYENIDNDSQVPAKYQTSAGLYNRANGTHLRGRLSGRIAEAIRTQALIMAASPAFEASGFTYEQAANAAAKLLDRIGGPSGMSQTGYNWYMQTSEIDNLGTGACPAEILWRGNINKGTEDYDFGIVQEKDNFPPSLYGKGRINPTQNLVDAFPMANGYPVDNANSHYDKAHPYEGRDPRLAAYIIYDGATFKETTITTGAYGTNNDAINREAGYSTRTGYYLRKLLREDCNANPSSTNAQNHYPVYIRYTEIFLDYAEAANEAWGPKASGSHSYSAYDVIKALHNRAGVGNDYLEECAQSKEKMRELIRNERRIELCFENKRFWDLRRWNANISETATGVNITKPSSDLVFEKLDVENRNYSDYMIYGPIPYSETLRSSALIQNKGWK